jgi:hypothetical protein
VNSRSKVTKEELEKAYAMVAEMEKELEEESEMARGFFFAEVQANVLDQNPPKFDKGSTMSQAFRSGLNRGVECVFNAIDTKNVLLIDGDDRMLNVQITDHGPDMISMTDRWVGYINS